LAKLVVQALLARPIFSKSDQALIHCDPHAGNLFFTDEERLAILDWSLVGTLGEPERVAIVQIMLGALTLHTERIVTVLEGISERQRPNREALTQTVETWLKRVRHGQLPGLSWLLGMLDDAVQTSRLRVGADLMLFRKTLHTLEGVLAEIGTEQFRIDDVLFVEFLRNFAIEWPRRWIALPNSREFATRLSNLDLTKTLLSYPSTVARFWMGNSSDLIDACRSVPGSGTSKSNLRRSRAC
jgi:ubiquinone biosynthesis protein